MGVVVLGIQRPGGHTKQLANGQKGSSCDCMIKLYTKNCGREIPEILGRPNTHADLRNVEIEIEGLDIMPPILASFTMRANAMATYMDIKLLSFENICGDKSLITGVRL